MEMLSRPTQNLMAFVRANHTAWLILSFFGDLLWLATTILPKDKTLWIFGAWWGDAYADNSKYLFDYVNSNQDVIRAVWLTKNKAAYDLVKSHGYEVYLLNSVRGFLLRVRSGVWVMSSGIFDFNSYHMWPVGRVKIVQLWHGTPLKTLGYDEHHHVSLSRGANLARLHVLPFNKRVRHDDLYIAPSEEVRDKPKVPMTVLLHKLKATSTLAIYMPTQRHEGEEGLGFLLSDLKSVNSRLAELNIILLVKLHFCHLGELHSLDRSLSNVLFVKDEDIDQDIYTILSETDLLITDYSSIYFDYLLLNKPIIFAPFDLETFIANDRPLFYNYADVTPGPKARNWTEVIECMEDIARKGDAYEKLRLKVDSIFNAYHDGNSSQRVFQAITAELLRV